MDGRKGRRRKKEKIKEYRGNSEGKKKKWR